MNKQFYCLLLAWVFLVPARSSGQNVAISDDLLPAHPRAMLDLRSSTKGLLIPRMSTASRLTIPATKGLLVYDSSRKQFFYHSGIFWRAIESGSRYWLLSGNSGNENIDFAGTGDSALLTLKVNNRVAGQVNRAAENSLFGYNTQSFAQPHAFSNTIMGGYEYFITPQPSTRGSFNTAMGRAAMHFDESGLLNTAMGNQALWFNKKGSWNAAFGGGSLPAGEKSTAIGFFAVWNGSKQLNTAIGNEALLGEFAGSGEENTAIGKVFTLGGGNKNTAVGLGSSLMNSGAFSNTMIGYSTGVQILNSRYNTGDGHSSSQKNERGHGNSASGNASLEKNILGDYNTAYGQSSMASANDPASPGVSSHYSSGVGIYSLQQNLGFFNTSAGFGALMANTIGDDNTSIGTFSSTVIHNNKNSTAIGFESSAPSSNRVRIGNDAVTIIEGQVQFTTPSDGRFKLNVQEDIPGLDFIMKLRPVIYKMNINKAAAAMVHSGFIAQEVEKAAKHNSYDFGGLVKPRSKEDYYKLSYEVFVVPLVKAVQERQEQINLRQQRIDEREKQIIAIQQQVESLRKK